MSDGYNTFEEYWEKVQRSALIGLDETEDYIEDHGFNGEPSPSGIAQEVVENSSIVNNYPRSILYHMSNGMYDEGYERYIQHREFEDNDPRRMLKALAAAAYFNDVEAATEHIVEARDDLGECMNLIGDHPIWDEGVTFEYEYEKGLRDPLIVDYHLESVDRLGNEWRMIDPDGKSFEVISPGVMVDGETVPEKTLKLKLDNICARREREREQDDE